VFVVHCSLGSGTTVGSSGGSSSLHVALPLSEGRCCCSEYHQVYTAAAAPPTSTAACPCPCSCLVVVLVVVVVVVLITPRMGILGVIVTPWVGVVVLVVLFHP
jgi:hypothetical protein